MGFLRFCRLAESFSILFLNIRMTATQTLFDPSHSTSVAQRGVVAPDGTETGQVLESLLERFLVSIIALAGARAGTVQVLTDDGKCMRLVAQQGLPTQLLATERLLEPDCGSCNIAAGSDILVWVDEVRSCVRHGTPAYFDLQNKSVLAIALQHDNQTLGIYHLFFGSRVELDAQTRTILSQVAELLGLTLHNDRVERERLRATVMKERQEMVDEVHDAIAQTLAYVKMRLPLLSDAMLSHDDARSLKYFSEVKNAVGEVHDNLREVMTYFRTRMDPLGLLHALQSMVDSFVDRTGIALEFKNSTENLNLTDKQEVQVFHIVQEALANIAKYSMAERAAVTIRKTGDGLEFLIEDDGLGIAAPARSTLQSTVKVMKPSTHFGMEIMQSRAQRLGGSLEVSRIDAAGTRVRLLLPLGPAMRGRTT